MKKTENQQLMEQLEKWDKEDRPLIKRALNLLLSVEEEQAQEHGWNYRVGFAYQLLEQEPFALPYFEKALEYRPGDEDTLEFIEYCKNRIGLPRFDVSFAERAKKCWETFLAEEHRLRKILMGKKSNQEVIEICNEILGVAFEDIDFELGYNGEKCELILSGNGDLAEIFKLIYFKKCVPAEVFEKWNVLIGRQCIAGRESFEIRMYGVSVGLGDVEVWPEVLDNGKVSLEVFSEKLLPLLKEAENKAWSYIYILLDQAIGEIPAIRYIAALDFLEKRKDEEGITFKELATYIKEKADPENVEKFDVAETLTESFTVYQLTPAEDDWAPRKDIIVGNTCCLPLVSEFLNGETQAMDSYHNDGIAAGFFFFSVAGLSSQEAFDIRDRVVQELEEVVGESFTFIGGAMGNVCGYIDFIAWDLQPVLEAAKEVFEHTPVTAASVQTYRAGNDYFNFL